MDMRRAVIISREAAELIIKYLEPWNMDIGVRDKTELYRMRQDVELQLGAIAKREIVSEARRGIR